MLSNKYSVSPIFLAVLFMLFIFAGLPGMSISADVAVQQQKNPYTNAEITIKIIPSANQTYGYDILLYRKPLVHQPNIPGLPGNAGFTTKERAQTVAEFVVNRGLEQYGCIEMRVDRRSDAEHLNKGDGYL
jgi:hypothetical protein